MQLNVFRNARLATQLYILVAIAIALAGGIATYALQQVKATQGTLKHTIDNRMVTSDSLTHVMQAFGEAHDIATSTTLSANSASAVETLSAHVAEARRGWDEYVAAERPEMEKASLTEAKPAVEAAYAAAETLISKIGAGELADITQWSTTTLQPAIQAADEQIMVLLDKQMEAARLDEEAAGKHYEAEFRNTMMLLAAAAALALLIAVIVVRTALGRLGADPMKVVEAAHRIAAGDLHHTFLDKNVRDDSLMAAMEEMRTSLLVAKLNQEGQLNAIHKAQAVIEFDLKGNVLAANSNMLSLMGYTEDEAIGQHHSIFVDAQYRQSPAYREFWEKLGRGEYESGRYRRLSKNGAEIWIQASYNPIIGADGKPCKVVKYATNITEQLNRDRMNAAFKGTLDTLSSAVMVADKEGQIIYLNQSAQSLMTNVQADLRKALPTFDAGRLLGQNIDSFHKNPSHQKNLLEKLVGRHEMQIEVGGRTMKLVAYPMKDERGARLGSAVEWFDRTQELATEAEVQGVITAVTEGRLENRIRVDGKSGFFATLSSSINELVASIDGVVTEVQTLVSAANDGDLTKRIETDGKAGLLVKIGSGINNLTENMAGVVSQVKQAASEVSRGADEISQGNTNLSQRTEEQASSLEETASSMEEMTSTVKQNADNAGQASQLAVAARDHAEKGGAVVADAVRAMANINEASKKIADIIGVIDEIAFQTNLLALNAAVEAARAGEQGRGFAVVASEVRNLAGRSATAAKEIKALIQDSVKKVDEGSTLVTQSGATLEQIVSAVKKVTDIVAEIAAASNEQSAGIEQVNKAVMQLDELTQQNAALVEEASAASQAMAEQARGLNDSMHKYKVRAMAGWQGTRQASSPTRTSAQPAATPAAAHVTHSPGAAAASRPQAAAAAPAKQERRKATRPWSKGSKPAASAQPAAATPDAAATDDSVWKEF